MVYSLSPDLGGAIPRAGTLVPARRGIRRHAGRFARHVPGPVRTRRCPGRILVGRGRRVPDPATGAARRAAGAHRHGQGLDRRRRVERRAPVQQWPALQGPLPVGRRPLADRPLAGAGVVEPDGFPGGAGCGADDRGVVCGLEHTGLICRPRVRDSDQCSTPGQHAKHRLLRRPRAQHRQGSRLAAWARASWPSPRRLHTIRHERREADFEINAITHEGRRTGRSNAAYDLPSTFTHEFRPLASTPARAALTSVMTIAVRGSDASCLVRAPVRLGPFIAAHGTHRAGGGRPGKPLSSRSSARSRGKSADQAFGAEQIRADIVPARRQQHAGSARAAPSRDAARGHLGDRPTGSDGATTVRLERLPPGLYRIEATVDGQAACDRLTSCGRRAPGGPGPGTFVSRASCRSRFPGGLRGNVRFTLPQSRHLKLVNTTCAARRGGSSP